ncbi:MAG: TetR/AcrR family transcriptional regulator [Gammaproteobacteria bacterium]|nr:TetR/AcrR family transcriptional regulator [Gammaproteobacteria bacterium]
MNPQNGNSIIIIEIYCKYLMSSSPPPQQDRSIRTQQALIDALIRLLNDQSFDEITVSQIAAEAGLTTGAIYRRFKDKRSLLGSAFERFVEESIENQKKRVIGVEGKSDGETVEFMVRSTLEFTIPYLPLMRAASALNDQASFENMRHARSLASDWWCTQISSSVLPEEELHRRIRFSMRTVTAVFRDTLLAGPGAESRRAGYRGKPIDHMVTELTKMIRSYLEIRD